MTDMRQMFAATLAASDADLEKNKFSSRPIKPRLCVSVKLRAAWLTAKQPVQCKSVHIWTTQLETLNLFDKIYTIYRRKGSSTAWRSQGWQRSMWGWWKTCMRTASQWCENWVWGRGGITSGIRLISYDVWCLQITLYCVYYTVVRVRSRGTRAWKR